MSEAVDDGPLLTLQNPADVVGETVFDCRPSVLPASIPLSGLSPGTVAEARESSSLQPSEETGKSIMDMDTNEITISRIVGFQWDEPGTDLEDEMPTPVLSPVSDRRPCDSSSGDSRSVRPGRRFRFRLSKGDVGRISDTIYDIAVRGIGGAAAVEGRLSMLHLRPQF